MSPLAWQSITDFHDAPTTCGVYQYWSGNTLLYIGKAINLKARLSSHAQNAKLDAKEALIVAGDTIRYTLCDSEFKALMLEAQLIREHKPPHNRAWKDDRSYLYIVIDLADPFPRPRYARAHEIPNSQFLNTSSKTKIFGPFPSNKIAEEVLRAIRRLIPFCMARRVGKHPCFYSRIGLCSPCPSTITTTEGKRIYRRHIRHIIKILEGNVEPVIKELTSQMKQASAEQDFETALKLRKGIERFTRFITTHSFSDRHFSYNNSQERLASLDSLLAPYTLSLRPFHRIECYDASNTGMYNSVVSLVVMTDGIIDKGQYRRFQIKNPRARSDFDRLEEALVRRLKNQSRDRPDLIVIDGGTPQLRRLQRIFDRLPDPPTYLGLAKRPDRLVLPTIPDFTNLRPSSDHPGLQLLQQLRDEAHRFANSYRQILEKKKGLPAKVTDSQNG